MNHFISGSILYHFLIMALGEDLGILYSSKLWFAMIPYGIVYVFAGQLCWLTSLQNANPVHISIGKITRASRCLFSWLMLSLMSFFSALLTT